MLYTKKKLLIVLTILSLIGGIYVFPVFASFSPRTTAPDIGDYHYYSAQNPFYSVGLGMPNCTAYAWGRAWEIRGTKLPAGFTGHAADWWNEITLSKGSTPSLGAIAVWSSNHVAIVEAIDGNTILLSESSYPEPKYNPKGIIFRTQSLELTAGKDSFLGYINIGDYSVTKPPKPTITFDHLTAGSDENTLVSWTPLSEASGAWMAFFNEDNKIVYEQSPFGLTSISVKLSPGTYTVQIDVWNSAGHTYSDVYKFYVASVQRPGKPMVAITSKTGSSNTVINWAATANTKWYDVRIFYSDGTLYKVEYNIYGLSYETQIPKGSYYATVTSVNPDYLNFNQPSDHTSTFNISYLPIPVAPIFSINKVSFTEIEPVYFSWNQVDNTTYGIGIDKIGVGRIETKILSSTPYSRMFEPGKYSAYVTASNSTGGSDSNIVYFEIIPQNSNALAPTPSVTQTPMVTSTPTLIPTPIVTPTISPSPTLTVVPASNSVKLQATVTSNSVNLQWDALIIDGLDGYHLYRATTSGSYPVTPMTDFAQNGTSYIDDNIIYGTTYYYIARPLLKDGTLGTISNEVCVKTIKVKNIILTVGKPNMVVDNLTKEIDTGRGTVPVIISGRTMIPIRAIIEEIGGKVSWDGANSKIGITYGNTQIDMWIGKTTILVNGVEKVIDVTPKIINDRIVVPLRFVVENLGCTVEWKSINQEVRMSF